MAKDSCDEQLTIYVRPKLRIIEELSYLPFEPEAAPQLFQLVSAANSKDL